MICFLYCIQIWRFFFFQNTTFQKIFRKNGYFHESYVIHTTRDFKQIITHMPSFFSFLFLFPFSLHNHHFLMLLTTIIFFPYRETPSWSLWDNLPPSFFCYDNALSPLAALASSFNRCRHHPLSTLRGIVHTFSLSM